MLEVGPLHPYAIGRLLKVWGKDEVVNVGQRANLYRAINQLREAELIAVVQTERDQQFPERTVYQVTESGRQARREWLHDALSTPRNEFPEFPAALSFTMLLSPEEALAVLQQRAALLRESLNQLEHDLDSTSALPRVTQLETDYVRAVTIAQLSWVSGVIDDLRGGALTWSSELADMAKSFLPDAGITTGEERKAR
jgi:DNA-binding PadR family transcriptional regulator